MKLGTASIGPTYALTFEASGALWTNGPNGVRRWPMKDISQSTVGIGPPQLVFPRGNTNQISCSLDGLVVAIPQPDGALVIHRGEHDRPTRSSVIKQHEDARYVSVSGDGDWVATGSHNRSYVKIWDSQTGECLQTLDTSGSGVCFQPGGRWLFTSGGGGQFWSLDTWKPMNTRRYFGTSPQLCELS